MNLLKLLVICPLFVSGIGAQNRISTFSQLSWISYNPVGSIDAVDLDDGGFVFLRNDSVFLNSGSLLPLPCPYCLTLGKGCTSLTRGLTDSFPLPAAYRGLPLQKLVRVFTDRSGNPYRIYFLMARPSGVAWRRYDGILSTINPPQVTNMVLVTQDSATLPLDPEQAVYGIDDFVVSQAQMTFKIFGKAGLRASVVIPAAGNPVLQNFDFPDSLDLSASAPGLYATIQGQILDSALNWRPLKMGNQPFSSVNSRGAAGNGGQYAAKLRGQWTGFSRGAGDLRELVATTGFQNTSSQVFSWETRLSIWDNRLQNTVEFIRDSTVWVTDTAYPPTIRQTDSSEIFSSTPDSAVLLMNDPDSNYSRPQIGLNRNGGSSGSLDGIWGPFSQGCGGTFGPIIRCYWPNQSPTLSLAWNASGIRIRGNVREFRWYYWCPTISSPPTTYTLDTVVSWAQGDTLRVAFFNASYNLINANPVPISESKPHDDGFRFRVVRGEIQWNVRKSVTRQWRLSDTRGQAVAQGRIHGLSGRIATGLPAGLYHLVFWDDATGRFASSRALILP